MPEKFYRSVVITDLEALGHSYARLTFEFPDLAEQARPGQFVSISRRRPDFPLLPRPFSIHRVLSDGGVSILFKIVGPGTRQLGSLKVGEEISVLGPLGKGVFRIRPDRPHVLLVAGGIGVAPFLFLAEKLGEQPKLKSTLIFGGRTKNDLPAHDDFQPLEISIVPVTEDGSRGRHGLATDELRDALSYADPELTQVLACGPKPMLQVVAGLCHDACVPCQVSLEVMMACGVGSCRGCAVEIVDSSKIQEPNYSRVCVEGPVFEAETLRWTVFE